MGRCYPFYFVIKRYEQTFRPGLCLSDSRMTVVHILIVGISLLDPYCFPRVHVPVYNVCLNPVLISLGTISKCLVLGMISTCILVVAYCPEPVI